MTDLSIPYEMQTVVIGPMELEGFLRVPDQSKGLVIFAHGSGSSRLSPRNTYVAEKLGDHGFATLLFDLLTIEEASDRANVFDIQLLGNRVLEAVQWVRRTGDLDSLNIGIFGASTGAPAALVAAATMPEEISAIVSRGGRPDMASAILHQVQAPTLLIVGGADQIVLGLNEEAHQSLKCPKKLQIVSGATHLFEEPGALDIVVDGATAWFQAHLERVMG